MMKKPLVVGIILILTIMTLTGCCKHEWQKANCMAPSTCSLCGKTEGEKTDHVWVEATCTEPKTCMVCGKTEGSALGHKFADAGYRTPGKCILCGAEGDTKPNYFTEKSLSLSEFAPESIEGPYIIYVENDREDCIIKQSPSSLYTESVSNGDGTKTVIIEYNNPVTCEYHYSDDKEYYYAYINSGVYDLYTGQGFAENLESDVGSYQKVITLDIDGESVPCDFKVEVFWEQGEWYEISEDVEGIDLNCTKLYNITVPEDYDGLVFGVKNYVRNTTQQELEEYDTSGFDENEVIFADNTGKYGTLESNGIFMRVGQ